MAKKVIGQLKLQVKAGQGQPVPARRSRAGSARPEHHGVLQGVQREDRRHGAGHADARSIITYYHDKSFTMELKTPPASFYLKKAAGLKSVGKRNRAKGSARPGRDVAGSVTVAQVREIAEAKMKDLNANDVEAAMQIILGSARSMGIEVKG